MRRPRFFTLILLILVGAVVLAVAASGQYAEQTHLFHLQLLGAAGAIVLFGVALGFLLARRSARPIEERRNLQEAILAGMAEGVLAVDLAGRVLLINGAGAALLRREPVATVGGTLGDLPGEASLIGFVARTLAAAGPLADEIFSGAEGGRRLLVRGAPLHDRAGTRIGALIVLHEESRLERLERSYRDFVASLSHELKTPLTTITGYTELLLDDLVEEPEMATRCLETIRREADRLRLIIDDLIVLARLDQEVCGGGTAFEPANLGDILAETVEAVRGSAELASVRVELECPETLIAGVSPLLLSQVVATLAQSAIAHSEPGGQVLVQATAETGMVSIAVRDWGPGIAPEKLPRVFERFYSVDSGRGRKRSGSGLGLAIVQHIAIVHGGTVTVESAPGQGSTFTIRIPAHG